MEDNVYCWNKSCSMKGVAIPYAASQAMQNKCPACKSEFHFNQPDSPSSQTEWPGNLSADTLPTWLAYPWAAYCEETHPRVKLHWLCDTAELVVRWTVALALAEVVHANNGTLRENVARVIAEHIERPTLGRWLAILRELCNVAPLNPVLTSGLFDWAKQSLEPHFQADGENKSGTLESSLLVLRNQVAHGGGMERDRAAVLVKNHEPTLISLLEGIRDAMGNSRVIANGMTLRGLTPAPCENSASIPTDTDGTWLVGENAALPLEPLAHYGPVLRIDGEGQVRPLVDMAVAQMYTRGSRNRLSYTPLGRDEAHSDRIDVDAFRALFQLDSLHSARKVTTGGFAWDDFLRESRLLAEDLVGRSAEIRAIKAWLKSVDAHDDHATRLGWISAGPGVGKSMVMARLASDYGNSDRRGLYVHRFRAGDARNNRRAFLRLLQAALWSWTPLADATEAPTEDAIEGQALEDDVRARLSALKSLDPPNERSPRPAFWVFIDGLDEAIGNDPGLPDLLRSLAVPGSVWLIAGRPEKGLETAFSGAGCTALFENGLPPMHADDIRAMLLEGLDVGRYALLARDEDTDSGEVRNAFVEGVVTRARGLPIYVHLLLEDLRAGHLNVSDEERLPDGLTAYYDELVDRLGVSDAKADLTAIVAILSQSMEPLDEAGLALLLAGGLRKLERFKQRVAAAIRIGNALLKRAASPDTEHGWTLYHQSFREYVGNSQSLAGSVEDARERLAEAARDWAVIKESSLGPIKKHLFRWGTEYALWWLAEEGVRDAYDRLTSFEYLQARTVSLPGIECTDLVGEYAELLEVLSTGARRDTLKIWEAFFRERGHILKRGNENWGSHKILLQLAVEHADDSPVTLAAEQWLNTDQCDWFWLRKVRRPRTVTVSDCLRVFEGHTSHVLGTLILDDHNLLSWGRDHSLRIWELETGIVRKNLQGHTDRIYGAFVLYGSIISWSQDSTIRVWNAQTGEIIKILEGHAGAVFDVKLIDRNQILSLSTDGTVRAWNISRDGALFKIDANYGSIIGAEVLGGNQILGWLRDGSMRLWDGVTGEEVRKIEYHSADVLGAVSLSDGTIASWDRNGMLIRWSSLSSEILESLRCHSSAVLEVIELGVDRLCSWSVDGDISIWETSRNENIKCQSKERIPIDGISSLSTGEIVAWYADNEIIVFNSDTGTRIAVLVGHTRKIHGVRELRPGILLSWSRDGSLKLWDINAEKTVRELVGHRSGIVGTKILKNSTVISWSLDRTIRIWKTDGEHNPSEMTQASRPITKVKQISDDRALTLELDGLMQIWDVKRQCLLVNLEGHFGGERCLVGALEVSSGNILSWSRDNTLRIWDSRTGASLGVLRGHSSTVNGVRVIDEERIISFSCDFDLRVWDFLRQETILCLRGHTGGVEGAQILAGSRVLSWSNDKTLRVWNYETGEMVALLAGHSDRIRGATVLRDGRILSWSKDSTLRIWTVGALSPDIVLEGHTKGIEGASVSHDGTVLSWSRDNTVKVWCVRSGALLFTFTGHQAQMQILGAITLQDRSVISWSYGEIIRWSPIDGKVISNINRLKIGSSEMFDFGLLRDFIEITNRYQLVADSFVFGTETGILLSLNERGIFWEGDGGVRADRVFESGLVSAHFNREMYSLQLYKGSEVFGIGK